MLCLLKRGFCYFEQKRSEYKMRKAILDRSARLVASHTFSGEAEGRILYDLTFTHHWLKNGESKVGISRVCQELYIALGAFANTVMVQVQVSDGKPELHKIDDRTLVASEEIFIPQEGDIYLVPEMHVRGMHVPMNWPNIGYMKRLGVKCCSVVYDILPLIYADHLELFDTVVAEGMAAYLVDILRNYDEILCDSKAVAESICSYIESHELPPTAIDILFGLNGNAEPYMSSGWHSPEEGHTWTSDKAVVSFYLCDTKTDITVSLIYRSFSEAETTKVFLGQRKVYELIGSDAYRQVTFTIGASVLEGNGVQQLTFLTENAKSPAELFLDDDARRLGISVQKISITSVSSKTNFCSVIPIHKEIKINYFHLGISDFHHFDFGQATSQIKDFVVKAEKGEGMYLMVGTVEPRKGHAYVLDGFERLWTEGRDTYLCVIGRVGWKMEQFIERMYHHEMYGEKMIFLECASDVDLGYAYHHARALIQASLDEGFGLPLIEAGQYGVPVMCSDIPVFHEIAGDYAMYFDRKHIDSFVDTYHRFQTLNAENLALRSSSIPCLSWAESATWVSRHLTGSDEKWYALLTSEQVTRAEDENP